MMALVALTVFAAVAPAQIPQPDPTLARIGAERGPLPVADLLDAALLASGIPETALPEWRKGINDSLAPLLALARRSGDQAAQAEKFLELLHDKGPFHAYSSQATTLVDVFNQGRFNCVSSAVVYLLGMRELGIPAGGVRVTDHAFCSVTADGRQIDVETTTAYGFDPGSKREFTDAFGRTTGYSYVPPGDYAKRESIDARRLVSLILSNRVALLEEGGNFKDALALAVTFEALEPGAEGRNFAIGRVNNLAAALMAGADWKSARVLADEAKARWGADPRIAALASAAADGELVTAIGAAGGRATLPFGSALALVDAALAARDIERPRANEFYAFIYGSEANRRGRAGDWLGAAAIADEGIAKTGGAGSLVQAARNYRHNYVVAEHNRFAILFNAGRYAEAAAVAAEGLAKMPGDPTLTQDLKAARAAGG
ncbi:MAG TPA: hypothetical protein VMV44_13935 [Rectinemataceae bacterium]|nr:hypothetical protein [Rectinemataceae bacterium]